jgi:hypothetical protein
VSFLQFSFAFVQGGGPKGDGNSQPEIAKAANTRVQN